MLKEVGNVISPNGVGVTIYSQSGQRMPQLSIEEDELLACTPIDELLSLSMLQPENIKDSLTYQMVNAAMQIVLCLKQ